jgi:hypothetical protein
VPIFGGLSRADDQVKEYNMTLKELFECAGVQSAIQQFSDITSVGTEMIFPLSSIEKVKDIVTEVLALLLLNDAVEAAIQYKASVQEEINEMKIAQEKVAEKKLIETAQLLGKSVEELRALGSVSESKANSSSSLSTNLSREQEEKLLRMTADSLGISVEKLLSIRRQKEEAEQAETLLKQTAKLLGVSGPSSLFLLFFSPVLLFELSSFSCSFLVCQLRSCVRDPRKVNSNNSAQAKLPLCRLPPRVLR